MEGVFSTASGMEVDVFEVLPKIDSARNSHMYWTSANWTNPDVRERLQYDLARPSEAEESNFSTPPEKVTRSLSQGL